MEDEGKDKTNEGKGSQQEKTQDTLQPNFLLGETITKPTNLNGKAITLRDGITTSQAYRTLTQIQIIKNLEGRADLASTTVLDSKGNNGR
jgi:hypothetical protein